MRKIILFNMVTLDGFFEGLNHNLDWHHVDAEFNEFAYEQLNAVDGIIFGRKTYELMASYWTTSDAMTNDTIIANLMNAKAKFVFSKTMKKATWNNTLLIKDNVFLEVEKLKLLPGKDLILFGSATLASTFRELDLIDEYRIMINPIILAQGNPLFKQTSEPSPLTLIKTKTFISGNVLLFYEPNRENKHPTAFSK